MTAKTYDVVLQAKVSVAVDNPYEDVTDSELVKELLADQLGIGRLTVYAQIVGSNVEFSSCKERGA